MNTLFIHIGCEKTGTTSIQNSLAANREILSSHGILYPTLGSFKNAQINLAAAAQIWQDGSAKNTEYYPDKNLNPEHEWQQLINLCAQSNGKNIVISAEHFSSRLNAKGIRYIRNKLHELRHLFTVKIIAYIRRQDLFLESSFSTYVKAGGSAAFKDFYQQHLNAENRYNFKKLLDNWSADFGKNNILLFDYDKEKTNHNLLQSFYCGIGLDAKKLDLKQVQSNSAWSPRMLEFAMICNLPRVKDKLKNRRLAFLNYCNDHFFTNVDTNRTSLLSPEQRIEIKNKYEVSNLAVQSEYLTGKPLFQESKRDVNLDVYQWTLTRVDIIELLFELFEKFDNDNI